MAPHFLDVPPVVVHHRLFALNALKPSPAVLMMSPGIWGCQCSSFRLCCPWTRTTQHPVNTAPSTNRGEAEEEQPDGPTTEDGGRHN